MFYILDQEYEWLKEYDIKIVLAAANANIGREVFQPAIGNKPKTKLQRNGPKKKKFLRALKLPDGATNNACRLKNLHF